MPLITPAESLQLEFPRDEAGGDASQIPGPEAQAEPLPPAGGDASPEEQQQVHRGQIDPLHYITHFPKDPRCPICNECKIQRTRHGKKKDHGEPDKLPQPQKFADAITADHIILGKDGQSRSGDTVSMVVMDRFTGWLQCYPALSKSAEEVATGFQKFLGPQQKAEHIYTDGSKEFESALERIGMAGAHDTSTPYRPQSNGVAERAVRGGERGYQLLSGTVWISVRLVA